MVDSPGRMHVPLQNLDRIHVESCMRHPTACQPKGLKLIDKPCVDDMTAEQILGWRHVKKILCDKAPKRKPARLRAAARRKVLCGLLRTLFVKVCRCQTSPLPKVFVDTSR